MKRITSSLLALLLALSMLIGMVPAAYAAQADTIESINSTETVDSTETEDVSDEAEEVAAQATEGTAVAEVNGNTYPDLKTAISAMSTGATLKLLDDVNLGTSAIGFYKSGTENLTFDLNGHTITSSYDEKGTVTATRNGLLIMNGTIVNNSTSSTKTTSAVYVSNGGTTTLRNVKLISNMSGLAVCDLEGNSKSKSATVTIEDDTTVGDNVQYGVYLSSLKATAQKERAVTLNINGGTITGTKNGVYVYGPGSSKYGTVKASITGGTVSDVMVSTGDGPKTPVDIAISGGTITGALTSLGTNEVAISGGTIIGDLKQNGENATISITGGTIGGALNNTNGTITVTGGTFTTDPRAYIPADSGLVYDAETGKVISASSTTGVAKIGDTGYETLAKAVTAANPGDTITLLDNIELTSAQSISRQLTIDLNGKTITSSAKYTIKLNTGADLTVKDSATGGKIANTHSSDAQTIYLNASNTTFTLESGTIESTPNVNTIYSVAIANYSGKKCVVNIKGGNVVTPEAATNGRAITAANGMTLNISGGEITGGFYGVAGFASSTTTITGGKISARIVDSGLTYDTYAIFLRYNGANVIVKDGTVCGIKVEGYSSGADTFPTVTLEGGTIDGSITHNGQKWHDFKLDVPTTSTTIFTNETAKDFLPDTVQLKQNEDGTYGITAAKKYVAEIKGGNKYETLEAAFKAANDNDEIIINAGTYEMSDLSKLSNRTVTVSAAAGATVVFDNAGAIGMGSASVTFKGITFDYMPNRNYTGLQHSSNMVYENCVFNGMVFLYGTSETFNSCTFIQTEAGAYNVWTYGAKTVAFNNCTFNCVGRCVLVYSEDKTAHTNLTVEDTKFNASAQAEGKAAIEIDTSLMTEGGATITVDAQTTATGFAEGSKSGDTLWNDKMQDAENNKNTTVVVNGETVFAPKASGDGTKANPYTLAQLGAMTRAEYIAAQERLGGTMYVTVGDYSYDKNGVLGNGERNDTPGQTPDHSKLNAYGENGYLGEKNDGANGKSIVFVNGSITSKVTGYESIDKIGTSLLLAVPAYTNVTFEGITFNNVMSFDYQLYTSPWSQLGKLEFDGCTFNGIIVGAIAAQTLTFDKCTFADYTNTVSANSSNPTWIRPAYGNWNKGDNEGQGNNFKSLTKINFTGNTVTSTRPVKFECIAQWEMPTTVTVTGNKFDISKQEGDTSTKNVGLYFGANAKFDLVAQDNTKSEKTAALYTAVYSAPNGKNYAGLPAGSTVKDSTGEATELTDAQEWKKTDKLTLATSTEVAELSTTDSENKHVTVRFATLAAAIAAAKDGDTVTLLQSCNGNGIQIKTENFATKGLTVDFGGNTYSVGGVLVGSPGTGTNAFQLLQGGKVTFRNGTIAGVTEGTKPPEDTPNWHGAPALVIQNYCDLTLKNMTITGGDETVYTMSNNHGNIVIKDTTITAGKAKGYGSGPFAFDVCGYSSYNGVSVTVKGSIINGDIEVSRSSNNKNPVGLTLEGGKINGKMVIDSSITLGENTTITKSDSFEVAAPTGYKWDNGTLTKITYVAEVNGKTYDSLQAAITEAADNDTVTLLADTTEDVVISKNITLDLNGFTLTNEGAKHTITVNEGVSLTIEDSVGTGKVDNVTHGHGALVNNGTVILSGGTFERSAEKGTLEPYGNGGNSWYTIANYGTMTINNGTTVKNAGGYSSNIRNGGQDSTAKLTINGGTFDGGVNTVKNDANGVLEIKGGELKNTAQYVIMNWNQATISGGTFETAETAGAVLFSSAYGTDGTACGELTITGGTFTAAGSKLIDDAYDANNHGTVKISGGSFNRAVDPKHCDTGFIPTQNEDGTYGVKEGTYVAETGGVYYESLQAAIDAAPRKGTVKLLADTRENVTINTPYLTLDLNGHTLNGGTEKGKPALTVTARVTVKDGSEAQTGTIMREDTAENSGVSSHYVIDIQGSGWLTFESGNVKNGSGVVGVKGASLVRVGDDSVAKYPGLNIKGGTFTQDNFIVIKVDRGDLFLNGGTLNSANSYAIEDWHRATIKGGTVNGAVAAWTYSGGLNSDLTISGGTINGDVTSVNYGNAEGRTAKVSITGGRVTGKLDTRSYDPATNELTSIDDAAKATIEVTGGTFNNDPTKYVVENSKVTNNADGTFGVEKAYLAKIGDKSYYTMDEAFHAVTEGQTIVLLRDYTTASSQNSGSKSFTFDLNGHTWTYTSTDVNYAAFEINYPDVTLTVKNGKVVSNSMLGLIPSAMGGTITYDNAGLVFEGIDATANGHSGIETNGNNTNDSVTLKNSTLNVPNGFGIYFPSSGTLTIENSKINAKTMGVQVCAGSLKISGADTAITVTGDAVPKTENDGAIQDGAAISIVNRTGYKGLGTITVTGGTFTAKTGNAAIKAYNYADKTESSFNESDKVEVSGGTFSAEVPADLCAVGYEPTKMDTGMYTVQKVSGNAYYVDDSGKPVYGDFAALVASTNAATKGKTITLLKNVKIEDNLVLFGNRTVDLNGNVLEITEIFIGLYGKVIDSSDGNGLLKIAADNVTLQSDNGLLPIYDSAKGGYRLFSFTMKQQVTKPSDTTVKFKFGPIFENKEAYKLLLTGNNHNIKVTVTLKWISGDGRTGEQTFTFPQNLINGIGAAEGGSGFVINLTGFDSDITGSVSNVTAQWAISSGTGASVSGTPSVIYE